MTQMRLNFDQRGQKVRNPRNAGRKITDIQGCRFGRLTVVEVAGRDGGGHVKWICQCDCGASAVTSGDRLRLGRARSCGCLNREKSRSRMRIYNAMREDRTKVPLTSAMI